MQLFNDIFPQEVFSFISDNLIDFALSEDKNIVCKQEQYLLKHINQKFNNLFNVRQVHGGNIILADEKNRSSGIKEFDGIVTNCVNIPIVIRTADCLPVFIYSTESRSIGLVHAGWRGTSKNILRNALMNMESFYNSNPKDTLVCFGPAIRSCCYNVGKEFNDIFPDEMSIRNGDLFLDLPLVNKKQLINEGVLEENIYDCSICTCCNKNYFSYRRQGDAAGRHLSVMMLRD